MNAAGEREGDAMRAVLHDMKTPLGALCALALLVEAHAGEREAVCRYAGQMRAACEELLALCHAFLRSGAQAPQETTPQEMACRAAALFGERVELAFEGDCQCPVRAQAQRIDRILLNLLSNAVKYSPSAGRIRLLVRAQREERGCRAAFMVSDEGVGMSAQTLAHLFEPGVRGEEAVRAGIPGSGMGLYASMEAARDMGGEITAQSRIGEGSDITFRVHLALCSP